MNIFVFHNTLCYNPEIINTKSKIAEDLINNSTPYFKNGKNITISDSTLPFFMGIPSELSGLIGICHYEKKAKDNSS